MKITNGTSTYANVNIPKILHVTQITKNEIDLELYIDINDSVYCLICEQLHKYFNIPYMLTPFVMANNKITANMRVFQAKDLYVLILKGCIDGKYFEEQYACQLNKDEKALVSIEVKA